MLHFQQFQQTFLNRHFEVLHLFLKYYHLLVYPRPNYRAKGYDTHEKVSRLQVPLLEISATHIRKLLKEGKSIRYLVPENVHNYIEKYHLWK